METFSLPLREIRSRFTWSEIVMLGWRSAEQTHHLKSKSPSGGWKESGKPRKKYMQGEIPENLPDRFFNEEGEVDLRQVTGRDAVQYLAAVGLNVPLQGGVGRN